jgi:RNA polymerase sigma-54 factor
MSLLDLRRDHRQSQTLSPRLQHAVRLLQMSSLDFAALLRDTAGRNPFLDAEDGADADGEPDGDADDVRGSDTDDHDGGDETGDRALEAASSDRDDWDADVEGDRDLWRADGPGSQRKAEDGELSALDLMAAETSLATHLHGQLSLLPIAPRDMAIARAIVESLDDDGYLRTPLEELVQVLALKPEASADELQIALRRVQSLDPAGVAARSVAECLQLQLPRIECPIARGLAQRIVTDHLRALAARDVAGLARALGAPVATVEQVCDRIRRLDPRPGWQFGSTRVDYIVPDVVVRKHKGQWVVSLNPAVVPKVRLNEVYAELFQRHRTRQNTELAQHLQEARWTLRNVEQRFSTILDVAEAIVRRQQHFLDYGPMAMKPLGLKEIAEEVGIHESTVSRVTNNKFMATPLGVYELKHFFSRAMMSANGRACSGTAIRGLIKDIIDAERHDTPLSDAEITRQLAQQGLRVARRTVTKYRQMLKIEAVERRRRHAA